MRRLAVALLCSVAASISASAAELAVTVDGIRNAKGDIRLSVYASPKEWPDHSAPGHSQALPAKTGSVTFRFDLPPGTYAIDGFHDEIGNGKFKTSLIGLPEEGYLFSNNVRPGSRRRASGPRASRCRRRERRSRSPSSIPERRSGCGRATCDRRRTKSPNRLGLNRFPPRDTQSTNPSVGTVVPILFPSSAQA